MWNSERVILDYVSVAWFRYLKIEERVAILYRDQTHCLPKWIRNLIFTFKNGGGGGLIKIKKIKNIHKKNSKSKPNVRRFKKKNEK